MNDPAMSKLLQAIANPMPTEKAFFHQQKKELHLRKKGDADMEAFKAKLNLVLSSRGPSAEGRRLNNALLFLKPHAATNAVQYLVTSTLEQFHVRVISQGRYSGQDIADGLFNRHFGYMEQYENHSAASDCLDLQLSEQDLFANTFSEDWGSVLRSGRVMTLSTAASLLQRYQLSVDQLYGIWTSRESLQLKLRKGLHICPFDSSEALLMGILDEPIYVVNGFWSSMKRQYLDDSTACIRYLFIEWDANQCSWSDMIQKVVGDGQPSSASEGSIRRNLMDNWRALGLVAAPSRRDNGVYISKSAIEAVVDRLHWVKDALLFTDSFGSKLLASNIPSLTINLWLKNPIISNKHLFDHVYGLDSDACLAKAIELLGMYVLFNSICCSDGCWHC